MERQLESPSPDGRAARDSRDSGPRGYTESPDAYVQPRQGKDIARKMQGP